MALPDGKFPSTGADAKPSSHDSYGIIRHQGWTPAILTHLSLLNERFLLAKSSVLLNLGQYKASYQISQNLLARNDSLVEANLNAGLALFNQGVGIDKIAVKTASQRRDILKYYRQALPYIEMYRKRCPDRKDKWALPLYTIYLNLNMGKQFDEIDKILKQ